MSATTFLRLNGDRIEVPDAALSALQDHTRGEVIGPDDAGYDGCRTVWNTMVDRRPARIARCRGAADFLAAIAFAREHDILCSVRGGGHNVAGKAVADDTLMIDLSPMQDIRVDPTLGRARVGAGCLWSAVDAETQAFGLAVPLGRIEAGLFGKIALPQTMDANHSQRLATSSRGEAVAALATLDHSQPLQALDHLRCAVSRDRQHARETQQSARLALRLTVVEVLQRILDVHSIRGAKAS